MAAGDQPLEILTFGHGENGPVLIGDRFNAVGGMNAAASGSGVGMIFRAADDIGLIYHRFRRA